jgi:phosphoserine aminotransferase
MAMWTMLGERPVEMVAWESFGEGWVTDAVRQLKLDARVHRADYGRIVDMGSLDYDRDVVVTWNGTTSGVRVPSGTSSRPTGRASRSAMRPRRPSRSAALGEARCDDLLLAEG